jgi:hypothetical protein
MNRKSLQKHTNDWPFNDRLQEAVQLSQDTQLFISHGLKILGFLCYERQPGFQLHHLKGEDFGWQC